MVATAVGGAPLAGSRARPYNIRVEERRRMWFDYYIAQGQYAAAQRIADAEEVPWHYPPPQGVRSGEHEHGSPGSGGPLHVPNIDPREAAVIIQKAVRGEQARAAATWLREERKHRYWLQYAIATRQFDGATRLGFWHEIAAMVIQRAVRRTIRKQVGYEVTCPSCATVFELRKVPEGRVRQRCPECGVSFQIEAAQQAWWAQPVLLEYGEGGGGGGGDGPRAVGALPFSPEWIEEEERRRREWQRYFLTVEDVDSAHRIGFQHEVKARVIQREFKRWHYGKWRVYQAEKAEEAFRRAVELERAAAEVRRQHAARVMQRAARRKRAYNLYKRTRLAELAANFSSRKADLTRSKGEALSLRFCRKLLGRSYQRAKQQHEAARLISSTYRTLNGKRAAKKRQLYTQARTQHAARVIMRLYVRHKMVELEKHSKGWLLRYSSKGKWLSRYFYINKHHLCYIAGNRGSIVPRAPNTDVAYKQELSEWEAKADQAKDGQRLDLKQVRAMVGPDRTNHELEITMERGDKHRFRASSEREAMLWRAVFERYLRHGARVARGERRGVAVSLREQGKPSSSSLKGTGASQPAEGSTQDWRTGRRASGTPPPVGSASRSRPPAPAASDAGLGLPPLGAVTPDPVPSQSQTTRRPVL